MDSEFYNVTLWYYQWLVIGFEHIQFV